jgi:hypothetical protein
MFILQQNQQWLKSLLCKCLEWSRGGAYWRRDKSGVRFTHECVKRTQIANPERTLRERRADPERTQGGPRANARRIQSEHKIFKSERRANPGGELRVRSGFARVLGYVRSVLYIPSFTCLLTWNLNLNRRRPLLILRSRSIKTRNGNINILIILSLMDIKYCILVHHN